MGRDFTHPYDVMAATLEDLFNVDELSKDEQERDLNILKKKIDEMLENLASGIYYGKDSSWGKDSS